MTITATAVLEVLNLLSKIRALKFVKVRSELADLIERHVERGHFIQRVAPPDFQKGIVPQAQMTNSAFTPRIPAVG
jgi:hypothetical protein